MIIIIIMIVMISRTTDNFLQGLYRISMLGSTTR